VWKSCPENTFRNRTFHNFPTTPGRSTPAATDKRQEKHKVTTTELDRATTTQVISIQRPTDMSAFGDLTALTSMMESAQEAAEARGGTSSSASSSTNVITPGSIVNANVKKTTQSNTTTTTNEETDPNAIWGKEEIDNHDPDFDDDGRAIPDYDILYKQQVGSEDIFLGMSGKTPLSQDCNFMVLRIKMPGAQLKNIDLTVDKQKIVVHDPTYRLATYLPYPTKDKEGKAQWLAEKDTLSVTLPIDRGDGF
jgi:hypothetical protein